MKMEKCTVIILVTMALSWSACPVRAGDLAMGVNAGTLGVGADLTLGLGDYLNARVGVQGLDYSGFSGSTSDVDYDVQLKLISGIVAADWYPFGGIFHISGGMVFNGNTIEADGQPNANGSFTLNDTTYTSSQVTSLHGKLEYSGVAPYAGLGWGNPIGASGWSLTFDIGAIFQVDPDLTLSATGPVASDPTFQANLEKERQKLKDELDKYDIYPVVTLGLHYRF